MSRHLSEAELVDVAEGQASEAARAHAAACAECRGAADGLRDALALARDTAMPEPAPAYWDHFRRQVERRIGQDEAQGSRAARWLVPSLVGMAAAVGLALLLRVPLSPVAPPAPGPALPAWSALPASEDVGLELIQALAPSQEDAASETCRAAYDCLASLSDDESNAVADTLRNELDGRSL
jgi:hypothetical protein